MHTYLPCSMIKMVNEKATNKWGAMRSYRIDVPKYNYNIHPETTFWRKSAKWMDHHMVFTVRKEDEPDVSTLFDQVRAVMLCADDALWCGDVLSSPLPALAQLLFKCTAFFLVPRLYQWFSFLLLDALSACLPLLCSQHLQRHTLTFRRSQTARVFVVRTLWLG